MRLFRIVLDQILIEHGLHLFDGLELGFATFGPEVLVQQGPVQQLHNAVHPASSGVRCLRVGGTVSGGADLFSARLPDIGRCPTEPLRSPRLLLQRSATRHCSASAPPHAVHTAGRDLNPSRRQFLHHPQRPVERLGQRMVKYRLPDLFRYPVGVWPARFAI